MKKAKTGLEAKIGKHILVRLVTHYYTGRLVAVGPQELTLEDAAWIADTGRFNEALKTGKFLEVEPYPAGQVEIGRGALVDCSVLSGDPTREIR